MLDVHAPIPNLKGIRGVFPLLEYYGAQHLAKIRGEVLPSKIREYEKSSMSIH